MPSRWSATTSTSSRSRSARRPSVDKAKAIVARLPVTLKIDGPQVQYNSHPNLHRPWSDDDGDSRYGPESWGLVRTTADGHRITFGLIGPLHSERPRMFGWITLAALLGLTLAAYAYVRRMLRPLQHIGEGVARFGAGDFSQPIAQVRRDELGDLARTREPHGHRACRACSMRNARCCWRSATSCAAR